MRQIYHPRSGGKSTLSVKADRLQRNEAEEIRRRSENREQGQRYFCSSLTDFVRDVRLKLLTLIGPLILSSGCGRPPSTDSAKAPAAFPTVASLAPAATDLIISMGAANHLVAISNYDPPRPQTAELPTAGDYQNTNWETLATVHPSIIIVQVDPQRIPTGLRDRATAIGATLLVIQIETLNSIFRTIDELGTALHEQPKASAASSALHDRLDAVQQKVTHLPLVPALISISDSGLSAAGPGTYLDELLSIAGGRNVLEGTTAHWPSLDRERLIALSPAVVIELLPNATPQTVRAAQQFWSGFPSKENRPLTVITDPWALMPGEEVGELAARMASALHPTTGASTAPMVGSVSP